MILLAGVLSAGAASRLAGKLAWATRWAAWRYGKAALQPVFDYLDKDADGRLEAKEVITACSELVAGAEGSTLSVKQARLYLQQHDLSGNAPADFAVAEAERPPRLRPALASFLSAARCTY